MLHTVISKLAEMKVTNTIALAGLGIPMWLPWLEQMNQGVALVTPALAAGWLITQIYLAWTKKTK